MDLGSANGAYVNGKRVKECELHIADVLELANTIYTIGSRSGGLWEQLILSAMEMLRREFSEPSSASATFARVSANAKVTGAF